MENQMLSLNGILGAIGIVLLVALVWRFASRRHTLPCPVWLRWLVELDNPFTRTNRAAFIVESLGPVGGMRILDAGCGPGRLTLPLARGVGPSGRVVAMDIQAGMLERTRVKTEAANLANVDFLQAGIGEGELPRGFFDKALLVTVLGEIPDRAAAFSELFDALVPGGTLTVVEVIFDPHFQPRRIVTGLARDAGFREKAFFGHSLAYIIQFEKPLEQLKGY